MGTKLECMDVLYIISKFQFQEWGGGGGAFPQNPSHTRQSLEALLRLRCTKTSSLGLGLLNKGFCLTLLCTLQC